MSPNRSSTGDEANGRDATGTPEFPGSAQIGAALERVLSNHRFVRADALARLLRFIVAEAGAGRSDGVKEYEIGVHALGRSPEYDPRVDPIVRVQARQLRLKLAEYYQTDGAGDEVIIELPKGTYAPVFRYRAASVSGEAAPVATAGAATPATAQVRRRYIQMAAVACVLVLVVVAALLFGRQRRVEGESVETTTIAVAPFEMDADPDDRYIGAGLSEGIARALQKVPGVRVVQPGRAEPPSPPDVMGRQLGVSSLIAGRVTLTNGRVTVSPRLVRVSDGVAIWSDTFEDARSAVFELQVRVAGAVAAALALEVTDDTRRRLESPPTRDADAELLYMRARFFWNQRSKSGMLNAIDLFRRAIERDPRYALAHAGLSEAYSLGIWYVPLPDAEARADAKRAALTAVELDPTLAEAHAALGRVHGSEWQWRESQRAFERAIQLNPSYANAYHGYAYTLLVINQRQAAVEAIRRAQQLDPLSVVIKADVAELLYHAGRHQEALDQARATLALDPNLPMTQWVLGWTLKRLGRDADAVAAFLKEKALRQESTAHLSALERAFAAGGWPAYWQLELSIEQPRRADAPYTIGRLHGWLGNRDQAFAWLERAFRQRDVMLMNLRIDLQDALGADPRFGDLLRRVGL